MNQGQTVFSQIIDFLPQKKFRQCVNRYNGNYRVRSFKCYDQLLCMAFAQLTYRESLRDIECCLLAAHRAAYLAGESPAAVIGCLPYSYNRRLIGVTRQAKARS